MRIVGGHATCSWSGAALGAVYVQPRTICDRSGDPVHAKTVLDLVVTGTDDEGLRAVSSASYSFASQQSLTRAIYTNMWPDLVVAHGPQLEARGIGGVLAAGFYDSSWQWGFPESPCLGVEI